jgi:hypothetical protein
VPEVSELIDLQRAFISARLSPRTIDQVMATSGKPISQKMTYVLALAIFGGFDLFPAHDSSRRDRSE